MPLKITDLQWSETTDTVYMTIPLKGCKKDSVDIFSSDAYVKVSFRPYLLEVDLAQDVDDSKSACSIGDGVVKVTLKKRDVGMWNQLRRDPVEVMARRTASIALMRRRQEEKAEEQKHAKKERERVAVKEQIDADTRERENLASLKAAEIEKEVRSVEEWRSKNVRVPSSSSSQEAQLQQTESASSIPAPRATKKVAVTFTKRAIRVAARESRDHEYDEYVAKNKKAAAALASAAGSSSDQKFDELNPMVLKDKADCFFKQGDLLSAINAYTEAIGRDASIVALYMNRSACHLQLEQLDECETDCTKALELLPDYAAETAEMRGKALVRRGTVYSKRGHLPQALDDYRKAKSLLPSNEAVAADLARLEAAAVVQVQS